MAQTAGGTYYAASSELVSSWPATSLDLANQLESRFAAKAATTDFPAGAWTSFTPAISASSTGWAFGNASNISAHYAKYGKLVVVRLFWVWGSTSTFGSAALRINMPVNSVSSTIARHSGTGTLYDASANVSYALLPTITGGDNNILVNGLVSNSVGTGTSYTAVTSTTPITMAASDQVGIYITYEAA